MSRDGRRGLTHLCNSVRSRLIIKGVKREKTILKEVVFSCFLVLLKWKEFNIIREGDTERGTKMRRLGKQIVILAVIAAMLTGLTACKKDKKAAKPKTQPTAEVKNGTAEAGGKGEGQSDVPLRIGCGALAKKFNPFLAKDSADMQAVALTQVNLVGCDRAGRMVRKGIDGVMREYNDTNYTYYGIADVQEQYRPKKGITVYRITLRDDLVFSDGEPITIDDVIFSLYAFCDTDYQGTIALGQKDIIGLLNYQTDNPKAEALTDKQVRKYIKRMPKKLQNWVKKHRNNEGDYDAALFREAKRQLAQQKRKKQDQVKSISGITRLNDYEVRIRVKGYDKDMLKALQIPVCPLHYYGDTTKYNYSANQFGFTKGDLSSVQANKTSPMGAGAYRFVKYESGIAYYMANELYYQGCPKIAYLHLKDMTQVMENKTQATADLVAEIQGDTVDLVTTSLGQAEIEKIKEANSNQKLSGKTITTELITGNDYGYIRMNADRVRVGSNSASEASKNLRKALATVFSACRGIRQEGYENLSSISNYPVSVDSWLSPQQRDEGKTAYGTDIKGKEIYQSDAETSEKRDSAKKAAQEYLEAAGYTLADGRVTSTPLGASTEYTVWIPGGESNTLFAMFTAAAEDLKELGITLKIVTITDAQTMQKELRTGKQQIWCGEEVLGSDPDLNRRYGQAGLEDSLQASVLMGLKDAKLSETADRAENSLKAEERISATNQVFQIIFDWGVELPVYQNKTGLLMSAKRIDSKSMTEDITPYYDWMQEIQNLEMSGD